MQAEQLKQLAVAALEERKGRSITVLDVAAGSGFTDYMIIVTGTSDRQVRALADNVVSNAKAQGVRPLGVEGERDGEWVLVDLGDVVVHVMQPRVRDFYNLEKLWAPMQGQVQEAGGGQ
jgi:ribosome-associated protein